MAKRKKDKKAQSKKAPSKKSGNRAWRTLDSSTMIAATLLAPKIANGAWWALTGRKAPKNVRHPQVSTKEALAFAALGGAATALIKTSMRRGLAAYWSRSTGDLPPGMPSLKD